jgi:hypothetical protein
MHADPFELNFIWCSLSHKQFKLLVSYEAEETTAGPLFQGLFD